MITWHIVFFCSFIIMNTSLTGGLVILYFFGGVDSMSAADGLPTALFLLAKDSANICSLEFA